MSFSIKDLEPGELVDPLWGKVILDVGGAAVVQEAVLVSGQVAGWGAGGDAVPGAQVAAGLAAVR